MKFKTLQLKKTAFAMLIGLLLSVAGLTNAFAQDQIAVLQHEGVITTYYGGNAFVDAYTAAENGDMITLSEGTFNGCSINKAITIHGAGYSYDSISMTAGTRLNGSIYINGGTQAEHLVIEGIGFVTIWYQELAYAELKRCSISHIYDSSDASAHDVRFINCSIGTLDLEKATNFVFINSVVNKAEAFKSQTTEKNVIGYNSYFYFYCTGTGCNNNKPKYSDFTNCILGEYNNNMIPESSCILNNCICIKGGYGSLLQNATHTNCMEVESLEDIFEDEGYYVLKDEIATSFLGTDGTQVGIYGGICPWTDRPIYMIMRHCTVGTRTTNDGHLSVDIEVVTEQ